VRASEGTIGAQFPSWHFRRLKVVATWQPSAAMTFIALSSMTGLLERLQPQHRRIKRSHWLWCSIAQARASAVELALRSVAAACWQCGRA
jgi:hypothetical protein